MPIFLFLGAMIAVVAIARHEAKTKSASPVKPIVHDTQSLPSAVVSPEQAKSVLITALEGGLKLANDEVKAARAHKDEVMNGGLFGGGPSNAEVDEANARLSTALSHLSYAQDQLDAARKS